MTTNAQEESKTDILAFSRFIPTHEHQSPPRNNNAFVVKSVL
jgi:hypothetical protein